VLWYSSYSPSVSLVSLCHYVTVSLCHYTAAVPPGLMAAIKRKRRERSEELLSKLESTCKEHQVSLACLSCFVSPLSRGFMVTYTGM